MGEQFARALASKDRAALSALFTDPIEFQALTPRKHWQAAGPAGRQRLKIDRVGEQCAQGGAVFTGQCPGEPLPRVLSS